VRVARATREERTRDLGFACLGVEMSEEDPEE
jgi:hypothetical protein